MPGFVQIDDRMGGLIVLALLNDCRDRSRVRQKRIDLLLRDLLQNGDHAHGGMLLGCVWSRYSKMPRPFPA